MGHYVNAYSELWSYAKELERKVVVLEAKVGTANYVKSSLEAEVAHLNGAVSKEWKMQVRVQDQKKELSSVLANACCELSKAKGQIEM